MTLSRCLDGARSEGRQKSHTKHWTRNCLKTEPIIYIGLSYGILFVSDRSPRRRAQGREFKRELKRTISKERAQARELKREGSSNLRFLGVPSLALIGS